MECTKIPHNCREYRYVGVGVLLAFLFLGCDEAPTQPISLDGLVIEEPDMAIAVDQMIDVQDMVVVVDQMIVDQMTVDQMTSDMELMDAPDGDLPIDGDRCDPRLRSIACDPGFVCIQTPGGRVHQGRCVEGDGCSIVGDSGCPENEAYCHLRGLSTECTQASNRMLGEVCLDEFNRALPCAEGLVCNFSICVEACDPSVPVDEQCSNNRRCVDLSEPLEHSAGFCGAIGSCNLFTNEGCEGGQQCNFAVRPDDNQLVLFCSTAGSLGNGEQCMIGESGADGCSSGLVCIGSPEGSATCKRVCDTGSYEGPCPDGQSCREILSQGGGSYIRSLGLCVINP